MENTFCDAIKLAIEFEKKSEQFYRELSAKTSDQFAKKALNFLAADEVAHVEKIMNFNAALLDRGDFNLETECRSDLPERVDKFINSVIAKESKQVKTDATDIDVYNIAMDMEKKGYEAYTKTYQNESEDPRVQKFFKFLAGQEIVHYNLLAASKKYLEDPSYYFEEYGGWIFG